MCSRRASTSLCSRGAFLLSDLTFDFYENPLRFARWLRGWRTAAMAAVSMSAAVLAVLITLSAFQATLAQEATAAQRAHVAGLAPARGQPDPKSLWASRPIPAVSAAVSAGRRGLRLPKAISPSLRELERENSYISYDLPHGCQPEFGPGHDEQRLPARRQRVQAPRGTDRRLARRDVDAGAWRPMRAPRALP